MRPPNPSHDVTSHSFQSAFSPSRSSTAFRSTPRPAISSSSRQTESLRSPTKAERSLASSASTASSPPPHSIRFRKLHSNSGRRPQLWPSAGRPDHPSRPLPVETAIVFRGVTTVRLSTYAGWHETVESPQLSGTTAAATAHRSPGSPLSRAGRFRSRHPHRPLGPTRPHDSRQLHRPQLRDRAALRSLLLLRLQHRPHRAVPRALAQRRPASRRQHLRRRLVEAHA